MNCELCGMELTPTNIDYSTDTLTWECPNGCKDETKD